jgi:hypothetical protein
MCISPFNFTLICLNLFCVADGKQNCLGASDEIEFCLSKYAVSSDSTRSRCLNTDEWLPSSELCNGAWTCGQYDDQDFCTRRRLISDEDILCQYYTNNPKERSRIVSDIVFEGNIYSWSWKGNRRLQPRIWTLNRNFELQRYYKSSYYGHLCQYQSERVSLTLGFVAGERTGAFTILIMLISEDGEIDSFDQLVYTTGQSCSVKFNRYLLFSRRPKDLLKNYSVRINAFGKGRL